MKNNNYIPPEFRKDAFNCPYCNAYSHQSWFNISYVIHKGRHDSFCTLPDQHGKEYCCGRCHKCNKFSIWDSQKKMLIPNESLSPLPNDDMPDDVKELYNEARQIQPFSPRASAALLRVALEKLTVHLGEEEGNLNTRIKNLKEKGLPQSVIDSLDIVRVTANEGGSHAGQIDLTGKDSQEIVSKLFFLVNFIVEKTITEPKEIDEQFNQLPEDKRKGIENRDGNN